MTDNKWQILTEKLRKLNKAAVAFSGGIDSSLLLVLAKEALGNNAAAITFTSHLFPRRELEEAKAFAKMYGIEHHIIETDDLALEELRKNIKDRCYYCKKQRFEQALKWAGENDVQYIMEGSNADDRQDFRPGMRVLTELAPKVYSPFLELNISKTEIRNEAKRRGLPNWDKPGAACLASRIEYNTELTLERLEAVEKAEEYLRTIVKGQLRVRSDGTLARIEIGTSEFPKLLDQAAVVNRELKRLGFLYVTIDLGGYRQGSQNDIFIKSRFS